MCIRDRYTSSNFLTQMEKEFMKIDKKLTKIANYEKMRAEGKLLNEEIEDLISRKDQFLLTIKSYQTALNAYQKSMEALPPVAGKDMSEGSKAKSLSSSELKKLSYFFAVTEVLKAEVSPNPLGDLPEVKRRELLQVVNKVTNPREDTCLAVMAAEVAGVLGRLLRNSEASDTLNQIMGNNSLTGMKFRFGKTDAGAEIQANTQRISKDELIHEQNVPVQKTWAEEAPDDSEEEDKEPVEQQEEKEDDGFEVVLSKEDARRAKDEGERPQRGRGRGRRRARGGYESREEGEFRSERRGRRQRGRRG
eukprot:TRINITY_DN3079_c0_g1_i3.p1 TRINITY_DN3079_c0_g1~~TRINITY_DN3079_c0_g1_i3.p1  ORF type:complete len:321 (+),score=77.36 TRINITY_DN3079_c0_g1_i3:47-964(+)